MRITVFIVLLLQTLFIWAQKRPLINYTIRDGLAQQQVVFTLSDSRGYVWCLTKNGLSKFDGEHFENFTTDDGMYGNIVTDAIEDRYGNIWITYPEVGFGKFDGQRFTNFIGTKANYSNLVEYEGKLMFVRNDSVFHIINNKIVYKYNFPIKVKVGSINLSVDKDNLYFNISNSIYLYNKQQNKYTRIYKYENFDFGVIQVRDRIILQINYLNLCKLFQIEEGKLVHFASFSPKETKVIRKFPYDFVFSNQNQTVYYSSQDNSLEQIPVQIGSWNRDYYKGNRVGYFYFGSETGLYKLITNGFRYFDQKQVPYAWGVVEDAEKQMWFQHYLYNLQKFSNDSVLNIKEYYPTMRKVYSANNSNPIDSYLNTWYYNPQRDRDGKLWFTNLNGLLIKEANSSQYHYVNSQDPAHPYFFNIAYDSLRHKIIGAGWNSFCVVDANAPYSKQVIQPTQKMFHSDRFILGAEVDNNHNYWLALGDVCRYNPDTKTISYYSQENGLSATKKAAVLKKDSYGGMWVGTFFDGLGHYNPKTNKIKKVFESYFKGQSTLYLGQISADYFIVGDKLNLCVIDLKAFYTKGQEKIIRIFNQHNGFVGLEPGQNGFYKDSQGRVWVTSGTVLSYFEPSKMKFDAVLPLEIYIRKINEQKLPFKYTAAKIYELEANQHNVAIQVEALGEGKSSIPEYSYRISGLQNGWSPWQKESRIFLTNMPRGTFKIDIRTKHNLQLEHLHPIKSINIRVNIPFYKSPDFYQKALFAFMGLSVLLGFTFWAIRRKNKEAKRNRIHNLKLEQKVKTLQIQSTQAQLNPHFIFNVLQTVQSDILIKNNPQEASENIINLAELIRSFLNTSIMDGTNIKSIYELEISLEREIELLKSYINFEKNAKNNFTYTLEVVAPLNIVNFRLQPLLIQPFVENAIKHGFQGYEARWELKISFEEIDEKLMVTIDDNGIGRAQSKAIQASSVRKYKSLGTDLVYNRINMLNTVGYDIQVQTIDKAQGTQVRLSIDFVGDRKQ